MCQEFKEFFEDAPFIDGDDANAGKEKVIIIDASADMLAEVEGVTRSDRAVDGAEALAKELGLSGITVNAVSPGVIKTDMLSEFSRQELDLLKDETPLNRIGEPIDVATAVEFLLSSGADFITGQVLSVNGGFVI